MWTVDLPRPEARGLAGVVLADAAGNPLPGVIRHMGGGRVELDDWALESLEAMAGRPGFAVTYRGLLPVLMVGLDCYPLSKDAPHQVP